MSRIDKTISVKLIPWLLPGCIALLIVFIINTFFFKLLIIPSHDMHPLYNQGDLVLLYKTNKYERNHILAYRYNQGDSIDIEKYIFIQRCVAIPGDTLLIDGGNLFINSTAEMYTGNYFYNYHIKTKHISDSIFTNKYNLKEGGKISNEFDFSFSMDAQKAEEIKQDSAVIEIFKNIEKPNFRDDQLFTGDTIHKWNKHNFGYLYIPKRNDELKIDTSNVFFYKKIIESESRLKIRVINDNIFLGNSILHTYTIKEQYYFVMGDNRDNAIDSRYFGFLPEKNILGRIVKKIYSSNKN